MRVVVRLFALAKQKAGRAEIALELPEAATVAALKRTLAEACPALAPLVPTLLIAVDSEYARDDQELAPGVEVAAIPPVSGGSEQGFSEGNRARSEAWIPANPREHEAKPRLPR